MKTIQCLAPNRIESVETDLPTPEEEGEALVKV